MDRAQGTEEVPPEGEHAKLTTATLLTLASQLASEEGAASPLTAAWGVKPPALGEEDFRALLLRWGYDQVEEGQKDEQNLKHQCYFVALREACHAVDVFWPAAALIVAILALLDKQHLIDHYESQRYGHVLVSQGPPGSAPGTGQVSASWRSHLRRRGAHGGEPLSTAVAHLLQRPILLICGTTVSVQMRLDTLARRHRMGDIAGCRGGTRTSPTSPARGSRGLGSQLTRSSPVTTGGTTQLRPAGTAPLGRREIQPQHERRRRAMWTARAVDGTIGHMQYKGHLRGGRPTGTTA